jgi:autotransporter-associated beta strand protein
VFYFLLFFGLSTFLLASPAAATDQTWKNTATDFNSGASWTSGTAPGAGDRALFTGAEGTQPNLSASVSIANLDFSNSTTTGYDLTSNSTSITLTLTSISTSSGAQAIVTNNTSGTNTIDAPIILGGGAASTQTFSIGNGGTLVIHGVISESGAGTKISKTAGGTLTLFGNNSFSGGIDLTTGTIAVGNDNALGSGTLTFTTGTTLRSADANTRTLANVWNPAGGASNTIFGSATTGDLILTDATSFALSTAVKTFTVNNTTTTLSKVFTGTSGGNGLTKEGTGTLALQGASTYNGATLVNAGTLLANNTTGSATGTGAVSVNGSGTTLGGTGTISGTVTLGNTTAGAILNAGPKGTAGTSASVGTLTTGALTLTGANTVHVDAFGTATTAWDKLVSTGAISLGTTSTLDVTIASGLTFTAGTTYVLLNGTSLSGTFAGITDGQTVTFNGYDFTADYTATGFDLVAVPEPGTWIGGALALAAVGLMSRKRFIKKAETLKS